MDEVGHGSNEEYGEAHLVEQEKLLSACVQVVDVWQDVSRVVAGSATRSSAIERLGQTLGLDADQIEAVLAMPIGAVVNGAAELRRNLANVRGELDSAERVRRWRGPRGQFTYDDSVD